MGDCVSSLKKDIAVGKAVRAKSAAQHKVDQSIATHERSATFAKSKRDGYYTKGDKIERAIKRLDIRVKRLTEEEEDAAESASGSDIYEDYDDDDDIELDDDRSKKKTPDVRKRELSLKRTELLAQLAENYKSALSWNRRFENCAKDVASEQRRRDTIDVNHMAKLSNIAAGDVSKAYKRLDITDDAAEESASKSDKLSEQSSELAAKIKEADDLKADERHAVIADHAQDEIDDAEVADMIALKFAPVVPTRDLITAPPAAISHKVVLKT